MGCWPLHLLPFTGGGGEGSGHSHGLLCPLCVGRGGGIRPHGWHRREILASPLSITSLLPPPPMWVGPAALPCLEHRPLLGGIPAQVLQGPLGLSHCWPLWPDHWKASSNPGFGSGRRKRPRGSRPPPLAAGLPVSCAPRSTPRPSGLGLPLVSIQWCGQEGQALSSPHWPVGHPQGAVPPGSCWGPLAGCRWGGAQGGGAGPHRRTWGVEEEEFPATGGAAAEGRCPG